MGLAVTLHCCSVIYPPLACAWGPGQPSPTQGPVCFLVPVCSIRSGQRYLLGVQTGAGMQGSLPEVAQTAGKEAIKLGFLRLELAPWSALCVALTSLPSAGGDSQNTLTVLANESLQGMSGCSLTE